MSLGDVDVVTAAVVGWVGEGRGGEEGREEDCDG